MGDATRITTVVTPAASYDLVELADFKTELAITDTQYDAYIARLVTAASAVAAQYCSRFFAAETVLDQFWDQRDHLPNLMRGGYRPLQLSRWPIISIDSVLENDVALVADTDYIANPELGQLVRLNEMGNPRTWANQAIAVQYEAGYATTPADLADAILRLMRVRWFARQRDPMLRSENVVGAYEAEYWFAGGPGSEGIPPDIAAIFDNYRVPVAAA